MELAQFEWNGRWIGDMIYNSVAFCSKHFLMLQLFLFFMNKIYSLLILLGFSTKLSSFTLMNQKRWKTKKVMENDHHKHHNDKLILLTPMPPDLLLYFLSFLWFETLPLLSPFGTNFKWMSSTSIVIENVSTFIVDFSSIYSIYTM